MMGREETTPARSIRPTAMSCASALTPPLASVTTKTSYPSASACRAGMATQISVHNPAMISFLRPVFGRLAGTADLGGGQAIGPS